MEIAVLLLAAMAYVAVYAAVPDRRTLRTRPAAPTRRLLIIGLVGLGAVATLGAITVDPIIGPMLVVTAAVASGSVLSVAWPLSRGTAGSAADRDAGNEPPEDS